MEKNSSIISDLLQREFLAVLIVVVNAFSWYFPLYFFFESILESFQMETTFLVMAFGIQLAATTAFALVGTALVSRFPNRESFMVTWMLLGIISSLSMVMLEPHNFEQILLVSFLLGTSLGLGFPTCLAYFGDHSNIENRGLLGGITFFASGFSILLVGLILSFSTLVAGALILAAWRGIGLLLFLLAKSKQDYHKEKPIEVPYRAILFDKSFLLYLIPWAMFCVVNFLGIPVEINIYGKELGSYMPIAESAVGGFVALLGGWLADSVGRKRIIIVGFTMLGVGFAVLGLFPGNVLSWYLYITIDGIAWGIFSLMFFFVIWSELAGNRIKEKYYLIGVLPFLIASYIRILFTPFATLVEATAAFSLASFFLFIAVLPLLYAPETMPQKKIELRRLRSFAEDAKKAKEKYERKRDG